MEGFEESLVRLWQFIPRIPLVTFASKRGYADKSDLIHGNGPFPSFHFQFQGPVTDASCGAVMRVESRPRKAKRLQTP